MKLWLSRNGGVSIREQLVAQIILSITSGDLKTRARLPSVRELARRFDIHPNTVSAAYRELAQRGWVEQRRGSGVFVRERNAANDDASANNTDSSASDELDYLLARLLHAAEKRGFTLADVQTRLAAQPRFELCDGFLLIEPDAEVRRILVAEIKAAIDFPIRAFAFNEVSAFDKATLADIKTVSAQLAGTIPVLLYNRAAEARRMLPANAPFITMQTRSVADSLSGQQPPPADALIIIASRCTEFLRLSRQILVAAGLDTDALDFRDARAKNWRRGIAQSHFVITDVLTAREISPSIEMRVFRIISDSSIAELQRHVAARKS